MSHLGKRISEKIMKIGIKPFKSLKVGLKNIKILMNFQIL